MSAPAPTARGRQRRELIVDVAATLFDERGFHGTSIDDIGTAAGISGPGLYRHFASKDAILIAVFDRIWERLLPVVERSAVLPPDEALGALVDAHLDLALEDPAALRLLTRELRHVPATYQRLAARNHGRYVTAWSEPLRRRSSRLDDEGARATALAVHGLIDSAASRPDLAAPAARRELLRSAATAAIHAITD